MTRNLDLAQQRANAAVQFINVEKKTEVDLIPVSLGSYGWLIEDKLPESEDFPAHRRVSIFACPRSADTTTPQN